MTTADHERRRTEAAQEAARLLLERQAGRGTSQERGEQVDWMRESALHVEEMLHAARVHDALGSFSRWDEVEPLEATTSSVVSLAKQTGVPPVAHAPRWSRGFRRLAWAASVAALSIVVALLFSMGGRTVIRTALGEHRDLTLADGSTVSMAPDCELSMKFTASERLIELDHGDAFFHVAKNPNRPFVVVAGSARIRAVGTAFGVQSEAGSVVVSVAEGRVAVTGAGPALGADGRDTRTAAISLGANEQVTVSASGGTGRIRKVDSDVAVALASGQLVVENEAVGAVVQRFNHYNRTRIVVEDQALAQRRISGLFKVTEPESFVALITSMTGVAVSRPADDVIVLGPTPSAEAATPSN